MDVLFLMCDGRWLHNLGAVTLNALWPQDVRLALGSTLCDHKVHFG